MNMNSTPDINDKFPETNVITDFLHFGAVKNFSGPVSTVDCFEDNSFVKKKLSEKNEGGILVVCGKKSCKVALLGDMIATMAIENGWSGIVINGYVRDIEILRELEIGVMALGTCPRKSKKENKGKIDTILTINSVIVQPGNWLYADANGILIAKTRLDL
jgi:regulator of ribonuclease activity A